MALPPLSSDEYAWEGKTALPAWNDFQDRAGPYESRTNAAPSTREYYLNVNFPGDIAGTPPSAEQQRAYDYLLEHQEEIRDALLPLIFAEYKRVTEEFDEEEMQDYGIPEIDSHDELKSCMGLSSIYILNISKEEIAYLGLGFGCEWDGEHGAGAMLHKSRIVEVGQASVSFESRQAYRECNGGNSQPPAPPTRLPIEPEDDGQQTLFSE